MDSFRFLCEKLRDEPSFIALVLSVSTTALIIAALGIRMILQILNRRDDLHRGKRPPDAP